MGAVNGMQDPKGFASFAEFYPFYLSQHQDRVCRRLHVIGSLLVLIIAIGSALRQEPRGLLVALLVGYGFAWVGHFFFEHNRPATFHHPIYSFIGDWVMLRDVLSGRIPF